jgi:AcrR family transcriptional regulator
VSILEEEPRRDQMLEAARRVISERGFSGARITDVAERAGVSPALVIYYFKSKDNLLAEAMRQSEDLWYAEMSRRAAKILTAAGRLEEVVAMTCHVSSDGVPEGSLELWLDLWAQALRDQEVRAVREEFDERFREAIRRIVREGIAAGEFTRVDEDEFAVTYSALLDGFAIQIALEDPVVGPERAFNAAMRVASSQLGFTWEVRHERPPSRGRLRTRQAR